MDDQLDEIAEFRNLIDTELEEFVNASQELGQKIFLLTQMARRVFLHELNFIVQGVYMERPDDATLTEMMDRMLREMREINSFREENRSSEDVYNHIATISESILALSWINVTPTPIQFIRDMRDVGQYYGNRVLSQYRGNPPHQRWINAWNQVLQALEDYVRRHHRTGFGWNIGRSPLLAHRGPRGDADARGPPPPPPPPPAGGNLPPPHPSAGGDHQPLPGGGENPGADNRQNLLRDLNQGVDIVRMLKPVNKGQASPSQQSSPSALGDRISRKPDGERTFPPKLVLDGRKWRVEHQKDRYDLLIESAEMSHSLAMFKCQNSGLEVRNKLNGVTIDNCKRATIVLRDIISSVELIRCQHVKLQLSGHVPLISVDSCDSVEMYLTENSLDVEVISSKSSSLNISVMKADGDYVELPVPEQIKTVVAKEKLLSTVVEKN